MLVLMENMSVMDHFLDWLSTVNLSLYGVLEF